MPRRLLFLAAAILVVQLTEAGACGASRAGGAISDALQIVASATAAVYCFGAARRSHGTARPFWLLFGAAMVGQLAADVTWSWHQDVLRMPAVDYAVVRDMPLVRTLLLTLVAMRDGDSRRLDAGTAIDACQLGIVYALCFLMVDYTTRSGTALTPEAGVAWMLPRFLLLAVALIRVVRTRGPAKGPDRGFLVYLTWYLAGEGVVLLRLVTQSPRTGTWMDFAWTVPPLAVAWWASQFREQEAGDEASPRPKSLGQVLAANAPFTLAPLVVLVEAMQFADERRELRYGLIALSILCFAARLGLSELRQARQVEATRQQERNTREQGAIVERLIEGAPEAIALLDNTLAVERVNSEFTRLFGYTADEVRGRYLEDLILPEERSAEIEQAHEQILRRKHVAIETVRRHKDGTVIDVWVTSSRVDLPDGETAQILLYRDIRERKRVEAQLLHAQKMEAVGRLAGGVAHDFNNLLTVINGYAELMQEQLTSGCELRAQADAILHAGEQAAMLTRQLLAFGRKQITQPGPIDLNSLIADSKKVYARLVGEDIELKTELGPDAGRILADRGQIQQVLMNLLANARDVMPRGGRIGIATAAVRLEAGTVPGEGGPPEGEYVRLTVEDTGPGMAEEVRAHVFEPFFTTKGVGEGTGLGLSIVYGIVRQSGGWVGVESEVGQGCRFTIYFPRLEGGPPRERAAFENAPGRGRETLLLVEDQDAVREYAAQVLESFGYRVLTANGAEAALDVARRNQVAVDLLVTDVVMPGRNGLQVAAELRAMWPGLRVLFTSGHPGTEMDGAVALEPGDAMLRKPFKPAELAAKVRQMLDR